MNREYAANTSGSPPAHPASPATGYPQSGNPVGPVPATVPGPYWYHMLTEEIRNCLIAAGITPDASILTQLRDAIGIIAGAATPTPIFVGAIVYNPINAVPAGYLKANGAAVSRTTYAALFAVYGTTYGVGDGSTTFNLPDLRGLFVRGYHDGSGTYETDTGRSIGSVQTDAFASHTHSYNDNGPSNSVTGGPTPINDGATATVTGATGGSETRPRNIAQLALVKY